MPYDPERHHRRSIRLPGYDYAQAGAYFVTIRTQDGECLFGEIVEDEMRLNSAGLVVMGWWHAIPTKFPHVTLDEAVLMPNHLHGIIIIAPPDPVGQPALAISPVQADQRVRPALPAILQWFKTMTTNECIRGVKQRGWPVFNRKLWQRNYYERIVRHQTELDAIRRYIAENPLKWTLDRDQRDA